MLREPKGWLWPETQRIRCKPFEPDPARTGVGIGELSQPAAVRPVLRNTYRFFFSATRRAHETLIVSKRHCPGVRFRISA